MDHRLLVCFVFGRIDEEEKIVVVSVEKWGV
jgi:hypothetical protein